MNDILREVWPALVPHLLITAGIPAATIAFLLYIRHRKPTVGRQPDAGEEQKYRLPFVLLPGLFGAAQVVQVVWMYLLGPEGEDPTTHMLTGAGYLALGVALILLAYMFASFRLYAGMNELVVYRAFRGWMELRREDVVSVDRSTGEYTAMITIVYRDGLAKKRLRLLRDQFEVDAFTCSDRYDLRRYIDKHASRPDAYVVDGEPHEGATVLEKSDGAYHVYVVERGRTQAVRDFREEQQAVRYMLEIVERNEQRLKDYGW
ncbi:hypothetical protein [Pseudoglutamicibacter cumminsii]|uniref:Uncharacterized protein n=1 Tax=Pseudoglutamicibacter cumminsii TaxID=156979 RepID=A0ABX5L6H4_9MICC|nr:hypothetical protein [Pseudoglutamicibacter cumminsii]PWI28441.1 hypothetical protein CAY35_03185 [Pseudoglutamicibacter cumminsii]